MQEGKKKMIMIGVIVVCIAAAIIITVATQSGSSEGGLDTIPHEMIWIKCRNPECENSWQMDKREYYEYIEKYRMGMTVPGVECPKCGEKEGFRGEKCEKCGLVFERGAVAGDFADRCPKCGYSAQEELRKKFTGGQTPKEKEQE